MQDGKATAWHLSTNTTTRTLYCLANRATKGKYSRFTLRLVTSKAPINDSANLTLGMTDLSHGGIIETSFVVPHQRRLSEITVKFSGDEDVQRILLPRDASILAVLSYLDRSRIGNISDIQLWRVPVTSLTCN
jgi:hypothetical protein